MKTDYLGQELKKGDGVVCVCGNGFNGVMFEKGKILQLNDNSARIECDIGEECPLYSYNHIIKIR